MRGRTSTLILAGLLGVSMVATAPAAEQAGPLRPSVPADFDPAARGLSSTPLVVEDLGLAMYPPAGATIIPQRSGGQLVLSIVDQATPPGWSLTIQHLIPTASETTADSQIENHLAALREAERPHRVLLNEPVTLAGASGRLCYIEQSTARDESFVSGWLILSIGDGLYLVFSLLAAPEEFPALRTTLHEAFATLNLRSGLEVADRRLSRIETARDFLDALEPERMRGLVGLERWSRIYRTDESGDTEIGYTLLEVLEGRRGELNPDRRESTYTPAERQLGLLVRVRGRVIGDVQRNLFYDSLALYWIAWDQSEEAWTVRGTQRQGAAERSEAETGFRTAPSAGDPRPMLAVIRDNSTTRQRDTNEWAVPEVYLSQALAPVLGRLLPTENGPLELAWYFYNYSQAAPQLTQRIDRWSPAPDGSGNWILRTQFSVDSPLITSVYSPQRELVRAQRPDGVITEPTTLEQLRRLWERKGLPMGRSPGR